MLASVKQISYNCEKEVNKHLLILPFVSDVELKGLNVKFTKVDYKLYWGHGCAIVQTPRTAAKLNPAFV